MSETPKKPTRRGKVEKGGKGQAAEFAPGGAAAPVVFDAALVAQEMKLWWANEGGDSFWIQNAAGWSKWPLKAVQSLMTKHFVRSRKREGEFLSDADQLLLYVREHRCVDEVMSAISGYPSGHYSLQSGEKVIVRYSPRLVEPKQGEWLTVKALIDAKLDLSKGGGPDQTVYFHGWMRTALEGLYLGGPGNFRSGQCLIFAGPADSGKSRLQHQVITGLLGNRSADPMKYMEGKTDFNGELFSAEHLLIEDPAGSWNTEKRAYFGEMLKQFVANDTHRLHRKREDAMVVTPFFRPTISINDDPDKMRVLPLMSPDMRDKFMIFQIGKAALPLPTTTLPERAEFRRVIAHELPAYAWFLLNEFEIPAPLVSVRFGVKEWHHPGLAMQLFDDTPAAELMTILDAAVFGGSSGVVGSKLWDLKSDASEEMMGQKWEGSAIDLERLLLGETDWPCSLTREAKKLCMHNKLDRLLGRLKEDQPGRVVHHRDSTRRWWGVMMPPE